MRRDDRGVAMAAVMLLAALMVMVSAVLVARAVAPQAAAEGGSDWILAGRAARSGAEAQRLAFGNASERVTTLRPDASKVEVVAVADTKPFDWIVRTPDGEFVVVAARGGAVAFAVGYSPGRSHPEREVRVLRIEPDDPTGAVVELED